MSTSLRMLTYNTQLRSWAMQVGASPGYTLPPIDTAEERATIIAEKLKASRFDYDVVALCEVFDEDAREILADELKTHFPYQVTKVDYDHVRVRRNGTDEVVPLLVSWQVVGSPHAISSNYRLEDGGLMLFSRFPFETRSTAGLDPAVIALVQALGWAVPSEIPVVNFWPYIDTEGNDGDACKGVVFARLRPNAGGPPLNIFATHTQADTNVVEEHKTARDAQMTEVGAFVEACCGGYPLTEETFVCGDFNVVGEQTNEHVGIAEWASYFAKPGHALTDQLTDLWGCHQAPGEPGARDLGHSASVRYQPQSQRLDYWLGSTGSQLAAQHLSIDYDLSEVPLGVEDVSYISDHKPLRIDLNRPRPNSTPESAHVVTFPPAPATPIFSDPPQWLIDGQVVWYRFNEKGTYDFALHTQHGAAHLEVYLDTDLSRPRQQYRKETHPDFGDKFVLTSAPFFVKVQPDARTGELITRFRAHKHLGQGPEDAIQLAYGDVVAEAFPSGGNVLNLDSGATPWRDGDTKWFRLDGPQVDIGRKLQATITIKGDGVKFGVALARESGGNWTLEDRQGPGDTAYTLVTQLALDDRVYVQVTRDDGMTPGDLDVTLLAEVDLSLLLGGVRGEPRIICQTETSGWGADDIELTVNVDGAQLKHIDNDTIGDFDQDDVRDLRQYFPDPIPYTTGVEFVVTELDDTSPDDVGRSTLPAFGDLLGFGKFVLEPGKQPRPDGTIRGALNIAVDDGVYAVQLTVAQWDETF